MNLNNVEYKENVFLTYFNIIYIIIIIIITAITITVITTPAITTLIIIIIIIIIIIMIFPTISDGEKLRGCQIGAGGITVESRRQIKLRPSANGAIRRCVTQL